MAANAERRASAVQLSSAAMSARPPALSHLNQLPQPVRSIAGQKRRASAIDGIGGDDRVPLWNTALKRVQDGCNAPKRKCAAPIPACAWP